MLGLITLVLAGKVKSDTISIDVVVLIGILTGADPNPQPKPGIKSKSIIVLVVQSTLPHYMIFLLNTTNYEKP